MRRTARNQPIIWRDPIAFVTEANNHQATHSPTPVPAVSAVVRRCGRYLLVRRANPPAKDMYAFPGGRVDDGESLSEATLRELEEETGLMGRNARFFRNYDLITRNDQGVVLFHFRLAVHLVDVDTHEAVAADDALDVGWYRPDEAYRLNIPDSVRECIARLEDRLGKASEP